MESALKDILQHGGIPAFWVSILTLILIAAGILLKRLIDHSLDLHRQKLEHAFEVQSAIQKELYSEATFKRELYVAGIRDFSTKQAQALRQAYLFLYESKSAAVQGAGQDLDQRVEEAIRILMQPLRDYLGIIDEATAGKVYEVQIRLRSFRGRTPEHVSAQKQDFFELTETARRFVKADKIAYRLKLISQPLEDGSPEQ